MNEMNGADRLTFSEALKIIEDEIAKDGFERVVGGVFVRWKTKRAALWISIAGNDYAISPIFGILNRDVDKIVNAALKATIATFKQSNPGVPLFRLTPERLSPGDSRIFSGNRTDPGYSNMEIARFIKFLRDTCYPFMEQHCAIRLALDIALRWNKFDQAQIYYIPALMLLLNRNEQESIYVKEVTGSLPPEGNAELYLSYIKRLECNFREPS